MDPSWLWLWLWLRSLLLLLLLLLLFKASSSLLLWQAGHLGCDVCPACPTLLCSIQCALLSVLCSVCSYRDDLCVPVPVCTCCLQVAICSLVLLLPPRESVLRCVGCVVVVACRRCARLFFCLACRAALLSVGFMLTTLTDEGAVLPVLRLALPPWLCLHQPSLPSWTQGEVLVLLLLFVLLLLLLLFKASSSQ